MLAPGSGRQSAQGWATAERMIADMDAAGLDKVVLMGEYRRTHAGCVARNDEAFQIIRRWPDRAIAFAMIQPQAGQAGLDELARCLDGGMRGVGELGPYGQGYRLDDPDFLRLAEAKPAKSVTPAAGVPRHAQATIQATRAPGTSIVATMPTLAVAEAWPETQAIFSRCGLPCDDSPVPFWEPIQQAAAARGMGPDALARLRAELNEAICARREP